MFVCDLCGINFTNGFLSQRQRTNEKTTHAPFDFPLGKPEVMYVHCCWYANCQARGPRTATQDCTHLTLEEDTHSSNT